MKLIFGFLLLVAAIVTTGGLYLAIRKPEKKKVDVEKLSSLYNRIAQRLQQIGDSLVRLYAITAAKVIPGTRTERAILPDQQSSATI
jgi:hypothetical protein